MNKKSNHPPQVLSNIPQGINIRLSRISADKAVFDAAAPIYQEALVKSGYDHVLAYEPPAERTTKKRCRKKQITWFNPPYSASVKSNVGKDFLKLLDEAFPPSNPLHKLFTRQTVKLSYKCMPNMAQAVSRQNKKILNEDSQQLTQPTQCNCQGRPATCPVEGKCRTNCVVYRATITETVSSNVETYTGMTGREFKDRWREHKSDIKKP